MENTYFFFAFLGGLLPALFWLWFLLREDREAPEPKMLIATSFLAGMLVVPLVLPVQKFAMGHFVGDTLILAWVIIEEVLKYVAALIVVLWNRAVDQPIDAMIYMITIALGFAALENALFIFNPLHVGDITTSILVGHFRFLGATLLHVLASGAVGAAMALTFYKSHTVQVIAATIGLFIAIVLHAIFNFFIMKQGDESILSIFFFVWIGIVVLFLLFERAKILEHRHKTQI